MQLHVKKYIDYTLHWKPGRGETVDFNIYASYGELYAKLKLRSHEVMCYDISFSTTIELITDYLPDIIIDPQISVDFESAIHVLAQSYKKYPIIIFKDNNYKLKEFERGVIADYMNTPKKIKAGRQWMCNAQSEKIILDKNLTGTGSAENDA